MNKETTTWVHGFEQRTGLETDQQRVKEILRENYEPKSNRIEIANRLIEGVTGRDTKLIMTKKELIDLILKDKQTYRVPLFHHKSSNFNLVRRCSFAASLDSFISDKNNSPKCSGRLLASVNCLSLCFRSLLVTKLVGLFRSPCFFAS